MNDKAKAEDRVIQQLRNDGYFDAVELIERLQMIESSWLEFMQKTEWVQTASAPHEIGKHRADVLRLRIEDLTAKLDAALAAADDARVEGVAKAMFEWQADKMTVSWDRQWEPTKNYWREKAREAMLR